MIVGSGLTFSPWNITASPGDTVTFDFQQGDHTATQSTFANPCQPKSGGFDSGKYVRLLLHITALLNCIEQPCECELLHYRQRREYFRIKVISRITWSFSSTRLTLYGCIAKKETIARKEWCSPSMPLQRGTTPSLRSKRVLWVNQAGRRVGQAGRLGLAIVRES